MTSSQIRAFDTADVQAMSSAQLAALLSVTPLVLDLDGNGVGTQPAGQGAVFDLTGTGTATPVGWVAGGDGLLAMDRNGDGRIGDGRELFGTVTPLPDGRPAGNGYAALAALDANGDNRVDAVDPAFAELRVWIDANHNGVSDPGELRSLVSAGIASLSLEHVAADRQDHGNTVGLVGHYTTTDGRSAEMADIWFERRLPEAPTTDEVLQPPAADLWCVVDGPAADAMAGPPVHPGPAVAPPVPLAWPAMHAATANLEVRESPLL